MYFKFLHDAAPDKYPLENMKPGATTTSKMASTGGVGEAATAKIPAFEIVMTKIKNIVNN
jgi:hypothetical protein